jgi:carboxyl-terminal processing protease
MHERGAVRTLHIEGTPSETGLLEPGQSSSGMTVRNPRRDVDVSLLWDVWDELIDHYIEPEKLQVTPMVYGAAEGLVRGVGDPYTVFMTPKENTDFRQALAGSLQGIGAELTVRDGLIVIVTPLKGSPAERAGLLPKDIIEEVDGQSVQGWSLNQVVSKIRGTKGTDVTIKIVREGSAEGEMSFTITRAEIHVPSVEAHLVEVEGKIFGYAALNQFGEGSVVELKTELQQFKTKPVDGIVLDLRNNGGGYLDGAIELASFFLREGTVVSVERRSGEADAQEVKGNPILPDMPLVVLQNEATASASEIVSGALQDHKRAVVVGQKSFGKGTVQEVVDLPGGSSLRVTVARWLTPSGKNLGKDGVHPDITVEAKKLDPAAKPPEVGAPWDWKGDPQLAAGVDVLLGKKAQNSSSSK